MSGGHREQVLDLAAEVGIEDAVRESYRLIDESKDFGVLEDLDDGALEPSGPSKDETDEAYDTTREAKSENSL